jgi:hypothetical protein
MSTKKQERAEIGCKPYILYKINKNALDIPRLCAPESTDLNAGLEFVQTIQIPNWHLCQIKNIRIIFAYVL